MATLYWKVRLPLALSAPYDRAETVGVASGSEIVEVTVPRLLALVALTCQPEVAEGLRIASVS